MCVCTIWKAHPRGGIVIGHCSKLEFGTVCMVVRMAIDLINLNLSLKKSMERTRAVAVMFAIYMYKGV